MRFDASLKRLQKAVTDLEKASKTAKRNKNALSSAQIDMFAPAENRPASNDVDIKSLQTQLDAAIRSVESILKDSA